MNITDEPPKSITINGTAYPVNWDFKVWIQISNLFTSIDKSTEDYEVQVQNALTITDIIQAAFGGVPDEPLQDILLAIVEFVQGYPQPDNGYRSSTEDEDGTRLYSFKYDLDYIILAIRNQSGIDLTYRRQDPFHWWDFLLEFKSLEEHHYISKIMAYRAYKGDDKEYLRLKNRFALPAEYTRSEQKAMEEMEGIFYNA